MLLVTMIIWSFLPGELPAKASDTGEVHICAEEAVTDNGGKTLVILVEEKASGVVRKCAPACATGMNEKTIFLPDATIHRITDFCAYGRFLAIFGEVGSDADCLCMMRLSDLASFGETIVCVEPSVSRTGRFIAFLNHRPRFCKPADFPMHIGILDMGASSPSAVQVYPAQKVTNATSDHRMRDAISPLAWSDDESRLAFLEAVHDADQDIWENPDVHLVVIDAEDLAKPRIVSRPVRPLDYAIPGTRAPHFYVYGLKWTGNDSVQGTLGNQNYWNSKSVIFPGAKNSNGIATLQTP